MTSRICCAIGRRFLRCRMSRSLNFAVVVPTCGAGHGMVVNFRYYSTQGIVGRFGGWVPPHTVVRLTLQEPLRVKDSSQLLVPVPSSVVDSSLVLGGIILAVLLVPISFGQRRQIRRLLCQRSTKWLVNVPFSATTSSFAIVESIEQRATAATH